MLVTDSGGCTAIDYIIIKRNTRRNLSLYFQQKTYCYYIRKMGIHGLMKLLSEECPGAIKEQEVKLIICFNHVVITFFDVNSLKIIQAEKLRSMHRWLCISF